MRRQNVELTYQEIVDLKTIVDGWIADRRGTANVYKVMRAEKLSAKLDQLRQVA